MEDTDADNRAAACLSLRSGCYNRTPWTRWLWDNSNLRPSNQGQVKAHSRCFHSVSLCGKRRIAPRLVLRASKPLTILVTSSPPESPTFLGSFRNILWEKANVRSEPHRGHMRGVGWFGLFWKGQHQERKPFDKMPQATPTMRFP